MPSSNAESEGQKRIGVIAGGIIRDTEAPAEEWTVLLVPTRATPAVTDDAGAQREDR